ncbi:MAG: 5-(carboxyamino)imidazole ribonucleotide mutase [Elusimicrobiota bacterium]
MSGIGAAIIMGSDSDLPVMKKAAELLDDFAVGYRMTIGSAHRSPEYVAEFVRAAEQDGVGVFIAAAGMAAHLAGAVAGLTTRPVIGVPMGSKLAGFDSLLSTVQMPRGVPVATVAIDGGANAALLAVQILALSDKTLAERLTAHKKEMAAAVRRQAEALHSHA